MNNRLQPVAPFLSHFTLHIEQKVSLILKYSATMLSSLSTKAMHIRLHIKQ